MSLRVWLPLNGNLNNQGLDQVTVTNNGAVVDNNGKIGKCYYFNGSSYLVVSLSNLANYSTTSCSMAAWVKLPDPTSGNKQILNIGTSSGWQNIRFGLLYRTNAAQLLTNISNGTNYVTYSCNSTVTANTWIHAAAVYENKNLKLYINGQLKNTFVTTYDISFSGITQLGIGAAPNGNEKYTGYINDVRIYDHALSPLEVKQISQGLILHYPLNRNGWGNENLHKNSDTITSTWSINQGTVSNGVATITPSSGSDRRIYQMPANGGWNWESNKTYTASIDARSPNGAILIFYPYGAGSMNKSYTVTSQWKRYSFTFTATQSGTGSMTYHVNQTSGVTLQLKHPKLELGQKATSWCPNSLDKLYNTLGLNDNIQYDTSGYGNNGTKVGISYSSDTPKYNISTVFDNNTDTVIIKPCYSVGQKIEEMSCSIWFKTSTLNSTAPNQVSLGENSFFRFRIASATSTWYYIRIGSTQCSGTFSCKNLIDNQWHHIVVIFDKGYVYVYLDSNLIGTGNHTSVATYMTCNSAGNSWHLGGYTANSENLIGSESDFRIYATALSAQDVLSLYNNSAYIDNQGNIYGAVYEEV